MILTQTLTLEDHGSSAVKPYVLEDDNGMFASFHTAQEAFAWIEFYTPAAITEVRIEPAVARRSNTLTEGEIEFTTLLTSVFHKRCGKCGLVFDDRNYKYYPCPEHPPV